MVRGGQQHKGEACHPMGRHGCAPSLNVAHHRELPRYSWCLEALWRRCCCLAVSSSLQSVGGSERQDHRKAALAMSLLQLVCS